jgi:hypothetical protein
MSAQIPNGACKTQHGQLSGFKATIAPMTAIQYPCNFSIMMAPSKSSGIDIGVGQAKSLDEIAHLLRSIRIRRDLLDLTDVFLGRDNRKSSEKKRENRRDD